MVTREEIINLLGVDFRRFLYDNFSSTETIIDAVTQTAATSWKLHEIELATGVQEASEAKIYYDNAIFNPWYSTLIFKLQFSSIKDMFAFVGIKSTTTAPAFNMTESHAGFMFYNGNIYASTGNGDLLNPNQQRTRITGWTPTNNLLYRITKDKFALRPLPIRYPYFDGFRYETPYRKWSEDTQNANYPPENQDHYFVAYITNSVGLNKALRIMHVVYGEEYAD